MRKKITGRNKELFIGFLTQGYKDYLSARILLINGLYLQGISLANTSIEKYFKAIKIFNGESCSNTHNILNKSFKGTIRNKHKFIYEKINYSFIELLASGYKFRYLDNIKIGETIVIPRNKVIAELDFLVNLFETSFILDNKGNKNYYYVDIENKNPLLFIENYILTEADKKQYVESNQQVYNFIKSSGGAFIEIYSISKTVKDNSNFIYELAQTDTKTFHLSKELFEE